MRAAGIGAEQALAASAQSESHAGIHRASHRSRAAHGSAETAADRANNCSGWTVLPLADADAGGIGDAILAEITALWQTDEVRLEKPLVTDEIRMGLDHYPMSLFATLPRLYAEMADDLREVYGIAIRDEELPEVLQFGSWIGGDRDGNPFVTADSTREALQRARNAILGHYIRELEHALEPLSSSVRQVAISEALQRAAGRIR